MSQPTSREEFKDFCLRALGSPVIEINVANTQIDDRVDQALKYYYDFHFDGSEKIYYPHQITANNISNGYITVPENIIGVVKVFDIDSQTISSSDNMFNIRYQIALNDVFSMTNSGLISYFMSMEQLSLYSEFFAGEVPIRYNRMRDRLYIDRQWVSSDEGRYLMVEAYEIVNPEVWTQAWSDRQLQLLATAMIKKQWGANLIKYEGIQLLGGITFNGGKIYDDATQELKDIEEEIINQSLPVSDMIG